MRGEDRAGDRAALTLDGITPACAGKTALEQKAEYVDWDHPRMRGEDFRMLKRSLARWDHPRMRGEDFIG